MHRDTMTRREEQMERDQLADYVLTLEQKLIDAANETAAWKRSDSLRADKERLVLRPLLERCLTSLDTIAALGTIKGDNLYKTLRANLRRELGKE